MTAPGSSKTALEWLITQRDAENLPAHFDTLVLSDLYNFSEEPGKVTCYLDVSAARSNHLGNLHGGCIGTVNLLTSEQL